MEFLYCVKLYTTKNISLHFQDLTLIYKVIDLVAAQKSILKGFPNVFTSGVRRKQNLKL